MKAEVVMCLLIGAALAVRLPASTGYLRTIGPSPIYFRQPRPRGSPFILPPLDMGDVPPKTDASISESTNAPAGALAANNKTGQTNLISRPGGASAIIEASGNRDGTAELRTASGGPAAEPAPWQPSLSPQALVPFFVRPLAQDTNAPKISVVVPLEFRPGLPPPSAPPSSATLTH